MASMPSEPAAGVWLSEPSERLARLAEALHVDRMADAVARTAVPQPEAPAGAAQEQMVVGILVVGLQEVVVDVLRRQLGLDPLDPHRLQFQHHQRAQHILQKGLIDLQCDFSTGPHVAVEKVGLDQLLRDIEGHRFALSLPFVNRSGAPRFRPWRGSPSG